LATSGEMSEVLSVTILIAMIAPCNSESIFERGFAPLTPLRLLSSQDSNYPLLVYDDI